MKRCPECRRDYYDDTLLYCLDDGNALLDGPATRGSVPPAVAGGLTRSSGPDDEPATVILSEPGAVAIGFLGGEDKTRPQIFTTDQTAILRTGAEAEPQKGLGELPERQSLSAHRAAKPQGNRIKLFLAAFSILKGSPKSSRHLHGRTPGLRVSTGLPEITPHLSRNAPRHLISKASLKPLGFYARVLQTAAGRVT